MSGEGLDGNWDERPDSRWKGCGQDSRFQILDEDEGVHLKFQCVSG